MSYGVQYPNVVDFVAYLPDPREVALVMIEERPWDGSKQRFTEIQEKVHNYVSFALDGQLEKSYPEYTGIPVSLQLHCFERPTEELMHFLDEMNAKLHSRA